MKKFILFFLLGICNSMASTEFNAKTPLAEFSPEGNSKKEVVTFESLAQVMRAMDPKMLGTKDPFKQALEAAIKTAVLKSLANAKSSNYTADEKFKEEKKKIIQQATDKLIYAFYLQEIRDNIKDQDIKKEYSRRLNKYPKNVEEVKFSVIPMTNKEKAESVYEQLKNGLSFGKAAMKYAIDPKLRETQGEATKGYVPLIEPEGGPEEDKKLIQELKKLKVGEFSKVITLSSQNQEMYLLLQVRDRRPFTKPSYQQSKKAIAAQLFQETLNKRVDTAIEKGTLVRNENNIKKLAQQMNQVMAEAKNQT